MPSRSVIVIAGVAIGLVALFALITQGGYRFMPREVPAASDTDADGSAYLREFLEEIGVETAISDAIPETAREATLILLEYDHSAFSAPSLLAFAAMGGRLIVTPNPDTTELPGPLEVTEIAPGEVEATQEYGGESLDYTTESGISVQNDATIRPLAVAGGSPVVASHRFGVGEIVVFSDPVILQNVVVKGDGATILLGRLFLERPDDRVVFYHDVTVVQRDANNPIGIFTTPRFLPFTLHALALLALFAWMSAVRFGTPIEERAGRHRRVQAHLGQIAAFFHRHGYPSTIDLIHAEWAIRELKRKLGLPPHTEAQTVAEHAATVVDRSASDIWELLEERVGIKTDLIRRRRRAREEIIRIITEEQDGSE